ncbi:MAG: 3-oxoacyl-[acyl-carrier-protein] reductase [Chlamydiia bacterium]|nr:3-oxoacyl-[acyl-carrier-protein] reductase [Chlamydiia bacterium]
MNNELLKDKVAIVSGGTSGIGKAIALKFGEQGAKVAVLGTHAERGKQVCSEIGANSAFYKLDVSNYEDVQSTLKEISDHFGPVDILVNNAGITRDQLLIRMSEEDWDQVMAVNLKSCYNLSHGCMRPMIRNRSGKIINISSVVGLTGNPGQTNYCASKAAMIGFTKSLAKEVAARNIHVNCIAPGFIETPMTLEMTEAQKEITLSHIPFGKMGKPDDIANAALFLASSLSDYITGTVLPVDGGMVMY